MSDFSTDPVKYSPGDRTSYLDELANVQAYEPSDIPGFVHPKGNKKLYVRADDPEGQTLTRDQALSNAQQGGALYKE